MFLLLLQFLVLHLDKIVGKDIPITVIIELIAVNLAYMVVMAVPMSILVACLMAFGSFAESNELAALKAAGISPLSVIKPVLFIAMLFSVFLMWFSNDVLPEANYRARALFMDIRMKKPGFDLRPNVFYEGIDGYSFLVRRIEAGGDSLFNITLFQQPSAERDQAVIKARYGYLSSDERHSALTLYLFDGNILRDIPANVGGNSRVEETAFSRYRIQFNISDLNFTRSDPTQHRRDDRTMSSQAMLAIVDSLNREIAREKRNMIDRGPVKQVQVIADRKNDLMINQEQSAALDDAITDGGEPTDEPEEQPDHELAPEAHFAALSILGDNKRRVFIADNTIGSLREMSSAAVNTGNSIRWRMERAAQYMVEVHKKISIPVGCMVFVLVGAPLGMLTRKGNIGFNAVISTIFFTYYWMGIIQGEKLADRMIISPFMGMWFTNLTLLAVGIILMVRLSTEFHISDLRRG